MNNPITRKYVIYIEDDNGNKVGQPVHFETTAGAITDLGNALDAYIEQFVIPLIEEVGSLNHLKENLKKLPVILTDGDDKDDYPTIINKDNVIGWNRIPQAKGYIELTLDDGTIVNGMTAADVAACGTYTSSTSNITVGGVTFRKDQVTKVRFGEDFNLTSLNTFGKNFTNLVEIDPIPAGITGNNCLAYFLQGCERFNQPITIPEGVTGNGCLSGFLMDCASFNSPITLPEGISGDECLQIFLYGCTSFNQPIVIPKGVNGEFCLGYFLQGCTSFNSPITISEGTNGYYCLHGFLSECTSFNQPITIPEGITGDGCMSSFLSDCTSFNQPITIPEGITGNNCLSYFLNKCTSFNQPITIPEGVTGDGCLNSFLSDCTSFNHPITIPEGISGTSCLYRFLYECTSFNSPLIIIGGDALELEEAFSGCTSFNQSIIIPNNVDNIDGFFENCDSMISSVTINNEEIRANDYTFTTSNPLAPMYTQGIPIIGPGADAFKNSSPNKDTNPYRKLI